MTASKTGSLPSPSVKSERSFSNPFKGMSFSIKDTSGNITAAFIGGSTAAILTMIITTATTKKPVFWMVASASWGGGIVGLLVKSFDKKPDSEISRYVNRAEESASVNRGVGDQIRTLSERLDKSESTNRQLRYELTTYTSELASTRQALASNTENVQELSYMIRSVHNDPIQPAIESPSTSGGYVEATEVGLLQADEMVMRDDDTTETKSLEDYWD